MLLRKERNLLKPSKKANHNINNVVEKTKPYLFSRKPEKYFFERNSIDHIKQQDNSEESSSLYSSLYSNAVRDDYLRYRSSSENFYKKSLERMNERRQYNQRKEKPFHTFY